MESRVLLTTRMRRPKIEQSQELQPNRARILLFRVAPVVLLLVMLGGCSAAIKQCRASDMTRLSTSGTEAQIPKGCVSTETGANGLAVLDCQGDRVGFMVRATSD